MTCDSSRYLGLERTRATPRRLRTIAYNSGRKRETGISRGVTYASHLAITGGRGIYIHDFASHLNFVRSCLVIRTKRTLLMILRTNSHTTAHKFARVCARVIRATVHKILNNVRNISLHTMPLYATQAQHRHYAPRLGVPKSPQKRLSEAFMRTA